MTRDIFSGTSSDHPRLAVFLIVSALAFLSFQDGLVKLASPDTSLWQFQLLRSAFNLSLIFGGLALVGRLALWRPVHLPAVIARTASIMVTMLLFFAGSPYLTLAEMGAGLYTYPLFMTVLSWMFLGERIGPRRIVAVAAAAVGAYLIVRPDSASFHAAQLLPVCAGFSYAINAIILRRWCRGESPVTMAVWSGFGFTTLCLAGGTTVAALPLAEATRAAWPFLLTAWPGLAAPIVGLAAVAAVCNVVGNILIVKAYQSAELSWLAPIDYIYLVFAAFWGLVLFSDVPDAATLAGMTLIAGAGTFTALRDRGAFTTP